MAVRILCNCSIAVLYWQYYIMAVLVFSVLQYDDSCSAVLEYGGFCSAVLHYGGTGLVVLQYDGPIWARLQCGDILCR